MMQSQMSLQGRDVGRFDTGRGRGSVTTETEISVMWPQAKDCQQPPEAGRCKEEISPPEHQKEQDLASTLILAL